MLEDEKFPYDTRRPAFKRRRWQVSGDIALMLWLNIHGDKQANGHDGR